MVTNSITGCFMVATTTILKKCHTGVYAIGNAHRSGPLPCRWKIGRDEVRVIDRSGNVANEFDRFFRSRTLILPIRDYVANTLAGITTRNWTITNYPTIGADTDL